MDLAFPPRRANADDIATHLRVGSDALNVLRVINAAPGKPWTIEITLSPNQELNLDITLPDGVDPLGLLDGTFPELFWCDRLLVSRGGVERYLINEPVDLVGAKTTNQLGDEIPSNGLRLVNYQCGNKLASDFMDFERIESILRKSTWLGSRKFRKSKSGVNLRILATEKSLLPAELTTNSGDTTHHPFSRSIGIGSRVIEITYPGSSSGIICRTDRLGELSDIESLTPIIDIIRTSELKSFDLELQGDWPFEMGPLGSQLQTDRLDSTVEDFVEKLGTDRELRSRTKQLRQTEIERQADVLNARVAYAKASDLVYWKDHVVGCVPRSELATVALISKLEGMDALPFARYDSLAWAGHEGIDAIVDLQFKAGDAMDACAPVEYEFIFANFITHGHPIQHVKLIICWDDCEDRRLVDGPDKWLKTYTHEGISVPVLVLANLPDINVRKPNHGA